jgi:hypothetical protein
MRPVKVPFRQLLRDHLGQCEACERGLGMFVQQVTVVLLDHEQAGPRELRHRHRVEFVQRYQIRYG